MTSTGTATAVVAGIFWGKCYANTAYKRRLIALVVSGIGDVCDSDAADDRVLVVCGAVRRDVRVPRSGAWIV